MHWVDVLLSMNVKKDSFDEIHTDKHHDVCFARVAPVGCSNEVISAHQCVLLVFQI